MILLVLLSARAFCRSKTAHIAAGIQPISVICSNRHNMPLRIRILSKKDSQGRKIAMSVMFLIR